MATYTHLAPPDERGFQTVIAKLGLHNWAHPEPWQGDSCAPEDWPAAAVRALIHLFTRTSATNKQPESTIPDSLGWHIATLIETWCATTFPITMDHTLEDRRAMTDCLKQQGNSSDGYPADQTAEHQFDLFQIERSYRIARIVQQWYANGIALYHALNI